MTELRVRLARAWGCSPVDLRALTLGELVGMVALLDDERRRAR